MNLRKTVENLQVEKNGAWVLLGFFLIAGVTIKFGFLSQGSLWPDEALYLYIARNLSFDLSNLTDISGRIFYHNPPLLMYLLSLMPNTDPNAFSTAARSVIVLMNIATIAITYFIGKKTYHPLVGLMAAGFVAVCPLSNWTSVRILTDTPVVFFIYLSICMLIYDKKTAFYFFGLCAVLTKYSAFPVLFLPLLLRLKTRTWAMIYAGIFVLLLGFILSRSFLPGPPDWISSFYFYFQIPDIMQMVMETEFFMGYFLIGFTLIGLIFTIADKKYSALFHWVILFGLFRFFLPWFIFRVSRYTLPLYPGLLILAAYGCYRSAQFLALKWPQYTKWVTLFFVIAISSVLLFQSMKSIDVLNNSSKTFVGYDKASAFLRSEPGPHIIATASPGQMKYFNPGFNIYDIDPNGSPADLQKFVREKDIHYLAIDLWSPHLPAWCRSFDFPQNGYVPIYGHQKVYVFKVLKKQ
ncbi:MAG: glycosyltransferase family 39 protein [Deltaproteobacteria bacterium]